MGLLAGKCLQGVQRRQEMIRSSVAIVSRHWGLSLYEYFYIAVESSSFFLLVRESLAELFIEMYRNKSKLCHWIFCLFVCSEVLLLITIS